MFYVYRAVDAIDAPSLKYDGLFDFKGTNMPFFTLKGLPAGSTPIIHEFGLLWSYSQLTLQSYRSTDFSFPYKDHLFYFKNIVNGRIALAPNTRTSFGFSYAFDNPNIFHCFLSSDGNTPLFSSSDRDEFLKKVCDYYMDGNNVSVFWIRMVFGGNYGGKDYFDYEQCSNSSIVLEDFSVDFAPLLKPFRIPPYGYQYHNIRNFCFLFGIPEILTRDYHTQLIKAYLKLLTSAFGGKSSDSDDLNINLKTLCKLVGVPTSDSGLKGDELSNTYIKRIGAMLGAKNV